MATCDGCGRPLCLSCAIPVRGRTLGAECLAEVLGPEAPIPEIPSRAGSPARTVARAAFAAAVLASFLPWSRAGAGSGWFGAWSTPPRWATLSAVAAVGGLLLSWGSQTRPRWAWETAAAVAGALVVLGAIFAIWLPPDFSGPWMGPWFALAAGIVASAGSAVALRHRREPERVRS